VGATREKPYSTDANIMHISFESGVLEDPLHPPIDDMYLMTKNPNDWPNEAQDIKITFSAGIPKLVENLSTNERVENSLNIMKYLNRLGGKHGIGRIDVKVLLTINKIYNYLSDLRSLRTALLV
jgi:argininosuccinate synthase